MLNYRTANPIEQLPLTLVRPPHVTHRRRVCDLNADVQARRARMLRRLRREGRVEVLCRGHWWWLGLGLCRDGIIEMFRRGMVSLVFIYREESDGTHRTKPVRSPAPFQSTHGINRFVGGAA